MVITVIDSLREAVQVLYGGVGVVSATFNDFYQYDTSSHKFTLAKLEHARISWSSENSNVSQLSKLQSLKAAITGDTLYAEPKNVGEYPMTPRCLFLFNINDMPRLEGSLEADKSRWGVLSFNKTFKVGADPSKGELEADPRFKYDPAFLQEQVVPALLNKMLAALPVVAREGIDYIFTEEALQEIRRANNHLLEFCQEVGLDYQPGGQVYICDLWEKLTNWYIENGIAEVSTNSKGKEKLEFLIEPSQKSDKYIKADRLLYPSFKALFPKITRERDYSHGQYHGLFYFAGLGFGSAVDQQVDHQMDHLEPLKTLDGSAGSSNSPTLPYALNIISKLSPEDQRNLYKIMGSRVKKFADPDDPRLYERVPDDPFDDPQLIHKKSLTITANNSTASVKKVSADLGATVIGGIGNTSLDNSTKNFGDPEHNKFKIGDQVQIDCPGSKYHGKIGTVTRLKQEQALQLADIRFPRVSRAWEAQVSWLRPVPPVQSNQE